MTGRDLVTAILKKIGAIAPGESISASEAVDGLAEVNRMLGTWSNERLMIFGITEESFSLSAGVSTYTLGVGSTWNSSRPQWIEKAVVVDSTGSGEPVDHPIHIYLSVSEFASLRVKGTTSDYPYALYDDCGFPSRTLKFYPEPSVAHTVKIFSAKPITSIASLDTTISLPPGYEDALIYNGAVRLAPEYGKTLSAEVVAIASKSKASIKRANHKPQYLKLDGNIPGSSTGYNIYTDDFK